MSAYGVARHGCGGGSMKKVRACAPTFSTTTPIKTFPGPASSKFDCLFRAMTWLTLAAASTMRQIRAQRMRLLFTRGSKRCNCRQHTRKIWKETDRVCDTAPSRSCNLFGCKRQKLSELTIPNTSATPLAESEGGVVILARHTPVAAVA